MTLKKFTDHLKIAEKTAHQFMAEDKVPDPKVESRDGSEKVKWG